jgi:hypothetical protein
MQLSQHLRLTLPLEIQNAVEALEIEVSSTEEFINHEGRGTDRDGNVINNEDSKEDNGEEEETRPGPENSEEREERRHSPENSEPEDTEMTSATEGQTGASQTRGQLVVSADIEYL